MDTRFRLFRAWLLCVSVLFGLQGLFWVLTGNVDPFGIWNKYMYEAFFAGDVVAEVETFKGFILGPFGASMAGYFLLMFCLVWFVFPKKEKWAYWAVVLAVYVWFIPDTLASLAHGAGFNVLIVNIPCIILLSIPLIFLYPYFHSAD